MAFAPAKSGHCLREQARVAEDRLQLDIRAGVVRMLGRRVARVPRSQCGAFATGFFATAAVVVAGFTSASCITVWICTMRSANDS